MQPILGISLNIIFIYFAFWTIRPINFEKIMPFTPLQAAVLKVILAVIMGYLLASFFLTMFNWITSVPDVLLR
ncbi:DUF1146 domain-containing protein [Leuconostoc fallax]|nr:DUF1146 domain-containing protein [Leuconostoc fallax]MCO6183288.1 DUF1146 domain-containing protein [Leuconostoc fallax]